MHGNSLCIKSLILTASLVILCMKILHSSMSYFSFAPFSLILDIVHAGSFLYNCYTCMFLLLIILGLCSVAHVKVNYVVARGGIFQVDHIIFKKKCCIL